MKILFLASVLLLQGCIVYPSKNVWNAGFEVSIPNMSVESVYLNTEYGAESSACISGTRLGKVGSDKYIIEPTYSWLKIKLFLPADCMENISICVLTSSGEELMWSEIKDSFCNKVQEQYFLQCKRQQSILHCEEV